MVGTREGSQGLRVGEVSGLGSKTLECLVQSFEDFGKFMEKEGNNGSWVTEGKGYDKMLMTVWKKINKK